MPGNKGCARLHSLFTCALSPEITVPASIRLVIVIDPPFIAFPVALKELSAIVAGSDPASAGVWQASPVTVMPFVMVSDRIPVAIDAHIVGAGTSRHHSDYPGLRWRADSDSD
jgi:hypothetical protein